MFAGFPFFFHNKKNVCTFLSIFLSDTASDFPDHNVTFSVNLNGKNVEGLAIYHLSVEGII